MKNLLAVVISMLALAACAAPTGTNKSPSTNASKAGETMAISDADVIAKEKQAWDTVRQKDFESFKKIMAIDGIYVSHHGVLDPAGTIKETSELDLTDLTFSDWKVLPIDKNAVVVTYTAHVQGRIEGQPLVASSVRGSTAWVNRGGQWLAIYHRDSEAKPAPTPGSNKPKATSGATPSEPSTSADPIANEKLIWETLKSNNSEAFAAFLASDSVEVEPGGVFDKAGSVKSVSQTDFSKATISDFKTLKIDENTALVTYMVKIPGIAPEGEHHTTIWINRGGKWLGIVGFA